MKENIQAVVKALETLEKDNKNKGWSRILCGEGFGKILKCVAKYTKVVDTAIQSNPQVSALVWAGIQAIMQVRIYLCSWHTENILTPSVGCLESCRGNRGA